jgi:hypothetical protein
MLAQRFKRFEQLERFELLSPASPRRASIAKRSLRMVESALL